MSVQIIESLNDLTPVISAWNDLADNAIEPNVFYESWTLIPALRYLGSEKVKLLLVWSAADPATLIGLFPLNSKIGYRHLPIYYLSLWKHTHCFLCTPLIRRSYEAEVFGQVTNWIDQASEVGAIFELAEIGGDDELSSNLNSFLKKENRLVDETNRYSRGILPLLQAGDPESYYRSRLTQKAFKKFELQRRNLEKKGEIKISVFRTSKEMEVALEEFLKLENSGWKGREGTALACNEQHLSFIREVSSLGAENNRSLIITMSCGNTLVASMLFLISEPWAYVLKVAYNEEYARFSPGKLLALEATDELIRIPGLKFVDSCTAPEGFLNSIWKERRNICSVAINADRVSGRSMVAVMLKLKAIHGLITKGRLNHPAAEELAPD